MPLIQVKLIENDPMSGGEAGQAGPPPLNAAPGQPPRLDPDGDYAQRRIDASSAPGESGTAANPCGTEERWPSCSSSFVPLVPESQWRSRP